jgi:hypothetical protein
MKQVAQPEPIKIRQNGTKFCRSESVYSSCRRIYVCATVLQGIAAHERHEYGWLTSRPGCFTPGKEARTH